MKLVSAKEENVTNNVDQVGDELSEKRPKGDDDVESVFLLASN
jgi:hypothetical protein